MRLRNNWRPLLMTAVGLVVLAMALDVCAETAIESGVPGGHPHHPHHKEPSTSPPPRPQIGSPATAADHEARQGGFALPDARDPHAYSGGYARGSGVYALPEGGPLVLADEHLFGAFLADRFERVHIDDDHTATVYDLQAWYGRIYDRLVLKADGEYNDGEFEEARTELLWGHAVAAYWDTQLGVRYDSGEWPNRTWLAFGVQGLAPYWFDVEATAYIGNGGRTALRLEAEYEILLTQRLILQSRIEASAYGKRDPERGRGTGLSSLEAGLRLRYEIRREFAPYIGIERANKYGGTADLARAAGEDTRGTRLVAGVRFWF